MDENRKLAEEVWEEAFNAMFERQGKTNDGYYAGPPIIAAYGEARYRAGMEVMRDAVQRDMVGGDLDVLASRLLEDK